MNSFKVIAVIVTILCMGAIIYKIASTPIPSVPAADTPIAAIVVTNASNNLVATYIIGRDFVERFDQRDTVIKRPGKPDEHLGALPASAAIEAAGKARDVEVISVQSTPGARGVPQTGNETVI